MSKHRNSTPLNERADEVDIVKTIRVYLGPQVVDDVRVARIGDEGASRLRLMLHYDSGWNWFTPKQMARASALTNLKRLMPGALTLRPLSGLHVDDNNPGSE